MAGNAIPLSDGALLAAQAKAGQAGVDAYEAAKAEMSASKNNVLQGAMDAAGNRGVPQGAMESTLSGATDIYNKRQQSLSGAQAAYEDSMNSRAARTSDYESAIQGSRSLIKDQAALAAAPINAQSAFDVNRLRMTGENEINRLNTNSEIEKSRFEAEARARDQAYMLQLEASERSEGLQLAAEERAHQRALEFEQRAADRAAAVRAAAAAANDNRSDISVDELRNALRPKTVSTLEGALTSGQQFTRDASQQVLDTESSFTNPQFDGSSLRNTISTWGANTQPQLRDMPVAPTEPFVLPNGSSPELLAYEEDLKNWNQERNDMIPNVLAPQSTLYGQNVANSEYANILGSTYTPGMPSLNEEDFTTDFFSNEQILREAQASAGAELAEDYSFTPARFAAAINAADNARTPDDVVGEYYGAGDTDFRNAQLQAEQDAKQKVIDDDADVLFKESLKTADADEITRLSVLDQSFRTNTGMSFSNLGFVDIETADDWYNTNLQSIDQARSTLDQIMQDSFDVYVIENTSQTGDSIFKDKELKKALFDNLKFQHKQNNPNSPEIKVTTTNIDQILEIAMNPYKRIYE